MTKTDRKAGARTAAQCEELRKQSTTIASSVAQAPAVGETGVPRPVVWGTSSELPDPAFADAPSRRSPAASAVSVRQEAVLDGSNLGELKNPKLGL